MVTRKVLGLLLSLTLLLTQSAHAQVGLGMPEPFISEQMLNNVVRIQTDAPAEGLGFIFGRYGDVLWIATAGHVAFPDSRLLPHQPVQGIRVQLRGSPAWFAPTSPPVLASHDIAFIGITPPRTQSDTLFWRNNVVAEVLDVGQPLRIAGQPGLIAYGPTGSGRVAGTSQAPVIQIDIGQEGQSGAPVASATGFVGMYLASVGDRVVPIATIRDEALKAGKPWQLSSAPLTPTAVRLCFIPAQGTAGLPKVNGAAGTVQPDASNCVQTMSGTNVFVPPQVGIVCDPPQANLPREAQQTMGMRCYVNPSGMWQSQNDGYVSVATQGDIWTIEGFMLSRYGSFKGLLTGQPPHLQVEMRTPNGNVATGTLMLEPDRLHGRLSVDGQRFDVDLAR